MYEKVDEREAIAQYPVTPVNTKRIDTNKAFELEPMQIRSRIVAQEFKSYDRADLYRRNSSIGSVEGYNLDCIKSKGNIFNHAHSVSRPYFHAKAQRSVLLRLLPVEDRRSAAWKFGLLIRNMYGTRDAASTCERDWQEHVKS